MTWRRLDVLLLCAAVAVAAATRLVGLTDYPAFFLGDEAVQAVNAAVLLDNGFHDQLGRLLPTYLPNGPYFNLGTSVYLQLLPHALFGFSDYATRAVSALLAVSAMAAAGLLLRSVLGLRFAWAGVLVLAVAPAWFLHSRTALEAVAAASFFVWALLLYALFRAGRGGGYLLGAIACAALAYYSYRASQIVVVGTGALLVLSDARFLWRRRRAAAAAAALAALLALPELRFQLEQGSEVERHLQILGSYLVDPELGPGAKARRFAREYAHALDPRYWYAQQPPGELERHVMKGYGHLALPTLPLTAAGLGVAVARFREPAYRMLLLALAAAPLGAALVSASATRALVLVVLAGVFAGIGTAAALEVVARRIPYAYVAGTAFALLAAANAAVLADALRNGPTWYSNYGLYGQQWGAKQVSRAIREELAETPERTVHLSPTWANGTDNLVRFFLPDEPRVVLGGAEPFVREKRDALAGITFVATPEEYDVLRRSPLFDRTEIRRTVPYPDGRAGFFFLRLRYSPRAAALIVAARARRLALRTVRVAVGGRPATVTHSPFDFGVIESLFDGRPFTLAFTVDANPALIRIRFDSPRRLAGLRVLTSATARRARVDVVAEDGRSRTYAGRDASERAEAEIELPFREPVAVRTLSVRVWESSDARPAHVHVRELELLPP